MAVNDQIKIEVTDKVASNIASKFDSIAKSARAAYRGVTDLQTSIKAINAGGITALATAMQRAATSGASLARSQQALVTANSEALLSQQRFATEQQRTVTESMRTALALQRVSTEQNRTSQTANLAAQAAARLADAQNKAATSAQKVATEQQHTATAANNAATAAQRLASEQQRTATAQTNAATAAQRLTTETARTATEQQRLATEAQRTATAQNSAAAALQRVATETANTAVAQQRLVTEQQRLATETQKTAIQQTNASTAQQRLATEMNRTTEAHNKASLAAQQLATEYYRTHAASAALQTAQARLATETQRLATEQQRTAIAAQRLKTEEQNTTVATNRAAESAARAELAALRLAQAQDAAAASSSILNMSMGGLLGTLGAIVGIGFGVKSVTDTADAYTNMNNRLRTVSASQEQVNKLSEDMFEIANRSRTSVAATTEMYVRLDRALVRMGKSQQDTEVITETIAKGLQISGANAQETSAAMLQLSQAFNAGKLQGDEFRSISENMPIFLDAVAAAANRGREEVKKMSTEGKIDITLMVKAFDLMANDVASIYDKLQPTVQQAMVVMGNQWTRFIGHMDQATGTTKSVANSIIWLSKHLGDMMVVLSGVATALWVAYGPSLIKMLAAATNAMKAFTLSVVTNPFGAIAVAIATATAALVVYGDQFQIGEDQTVSWLDFTKGAFVAAGDVMQSVADSINDSWRGMLEMMSQDQEQLPSEWSNVWTTLYEVCKKVLNVIIGIHYAMIVTTTNRWKKWTDMIVHCFLDIEDAALTCVEYFLKIWKDTLEGLASVVKYFDKDMAKSLEDSVNGIDVKFQRHTWSNLGDNAAEAITSAWKSAFTTDFIGEAYDAVYSRAKVIAANRHKAESDNANAQLRGSGANQIKPMAGRVKKSDAEKAYESQLKAIRKPELEHNAALSAANTLLSKGEISQGRYNALVEKANESYQGAIDPLYKYNKQSQQQLELYQKVGPEAEALSVIQQQRQAAIEAGLPWEEKYNDQILEQVKALEEAKTRHEVMNTIYDETIGKQQTLVTQQNAYTEALNKGTISFEQYQNATAKLNVEMANLKLQMGEGSFSDVMTGAMGTVVSNYNGMMSGLSSAFGTFFTNFTDGFASSIGQAIIQGDSLTDTLTDVARSVTQELITALVKLGVQYLINSTLASTTMAATTTASTAMAAATTAAWTPAAAAVSIATFGAAAVAGTASMLTSVGTLQTTMVALSKAGAATGYKDGGYTGDIGENQIAGVVHGGEYVMPANRVTPENRDTLDAMKSGSDLSSLKQNTDNAGSARTVNFYFSTTNDIDMESKGSDTDDDKVEKIMNEASKLCQAQMADSIRRGGSWATLIRSVM